MLDSLRENGHSHEAVLEFLSAVDDERTEDAATVARRDHGVTSVAGLDLGPRRGRGLLSRLFGGR
jgi:hypothetical protein